MTATCYRFRGYHWMRGSAITECEVALSLNARLHYHWMRESETAHTHTQKDLPKKKEKKRRRPGYLSISVISQSGHDLSTKKRICPTASYWYISLSGVATVRGFPEFHRFQIRFPHVKGVLLLAEFSVSSSSFTVRWHLITKCTATCSIFYLMKLLL